MNNRDQYQCNKKEYIQLCKYVDCTNSAQIGGMWWSATSEKNFDKDTSSKKRTVYQLSNLVFNLLPTEKIIKSMYLYNLFLQSNKILNIEQIVKLIKYKTCAYAMLAQQCNSMSISQVI